MNSNNFALTTLSQNPEYFEEVIRLIEEEFHYNDEHSFEKDFAPLIDPLNFENCFLYIDNNSNTVVAHLAVCIRTLIKNSSEIKIGLIGGIVTSQKHQRNNLFKNLMNNAIETYKDKVGLFILWSDLEGLYEKFNFYRTGGLIEYGKKIIGVSERPAGFEKTNFSTLSDSDFETITNLYHSFNEKYFFTIKREDQDWSIIRTMSSIDLYVKRNLNSEIEKYFCINKGRDLTNIIHEISCLNLDLYPKLLKQLENFKVWLPETELAKVTDKEIFYTAFIKLGNIEHLNKFLKEISNDQLHISTMSDEVLLFSFHQKEYSVTPKDFLQYIFGPKPLEEFTDFGLSIYIAGADSI